MHIVIIVSVDPRSDRAVYRQVADILRGLIADGTIVPGALLPSEKQLADTYGVGRDAVRQAIGLLRAEGLARTIRGEGTQVRQPVERRPVPLLPRTHAIARMPTEHERAELDLDEGVPVIAIRTSKGHEDIHPADTVYLVAKD